MAEEIASLGHLISPATLKRGLLYFMARNNNEPNQQVHDMAHLALMIASSWAKLTEVEHAEIKRIAAKCKLDRKGLVLKVRERLRQFRDEGVTDKLLELPQELLAAARRMPHNTRSGMLVQSAVALAILTNAPIRIGNLRCLDRNRHLVSAFSTKKPGTPLVLSKDEVKNNVDLEYALLPSPWRSLTST